jgi:hypothetical protein
VKNSKESCLSRSWTLARLGIRGRQRNEGNYGS